MTDINKVTVVGRLTRDSHLEYTPSGTAIAKFSIANNQTRKQGDDYIDEVSYFDVRFWGKRAESLNQYLVKGKQVIVSGRLKQERWVKDNQSHSRIMIVCEDIQLLNSGKNQNNQSNTNNYSQAPNSDLDSIPF